MPNHRKSTAAPWLLTLLAVIVICGTAVYWFLHREPGNQSAGPKPESSTVAEPGSGETLPVPKEPVLDYSRLEKDQDLRALMEQRKERLGVDRGVDMILREDESLKVGDLTIPMAEILDKIRLKQGRVIEKDIGTVARERRISDDPEWLESQISTIRQRVEELNSLLANPALGSDDPKRSAAERELADLDRILERYGHYRSVLERLREAEDRAAAGDSEATAEVSALRQEKQAMERWLAERLAPEKDLSLYGIHVVLPGENIWNIHFDFLKDYFGRRGIVLSPRSDEPRSGGRSSGVGKLLKFSENMVHIYNLRERKLSLDLDMLQPFSKIVVFNLTEVLSLLEQLNAEKVDRIEFDGETIWIPAEE